MAINRTQDLRTNTIKYIVDNKFTKEEVEDALHCILLNDLPTFQGELFLNEKED
jgi:hypothetical protein